MPVFANVDDYIEAQPAAAQARLRELRMAIQAVLPDATEAISYGIPTYRLHGNVVHFGAAKHHCALYGAPLHEFTSELQGYRVVNGTLRFRLDQPIPDDLVRKLAQAALAARDAARASRLTARRAASSR